MAKKRDTKGVFSDARLPIATRYLYPARQRRLLLIGAVAGLVTIAAIGLTVLVSGSRILSPGPLSSHHATFERDCASCHSSFRKVASDSCLVCHSRVNEDHGRYSFAAHYAYRSGSPRAGQPAHELACATCHTEHNGRQAGITHVADSACASCHTFGSFDRGHPEFEAARRTPPPSTLHFSHRYHVAQLRHEGGFSDPQLACLQCHTPDGQGDRFQPVSFDRACARCHLPGSSSTPRLPIARSPQDAGVLTADAIARQQGAGAVWALTANPNEYRQTGDGVSKRPVHHADPWILENLARIRRLLHPDLGLAALLRAAPPRAGGNGQSEPLYVEAIQALRDRIAGLRNRPEPEVQQELKQLESLLALAESRVRESGIKPPLASFLPSGRPSGLPSTQTAALQQLAIDLTQPCQQCHQVSDAAILRVDQGPFLARAQFSHRVHRLQRPFCLDCHAGIAGLDEVGTAAVADRPVEDPPTRNLPSIAVCRTCHTATAASNRCATCHLFHPDAGHENDLVRYRRGDGAP